MLPKIDKDKENKSNSINPVEIIKKDIKKVNDELLKTNERLNSTKEKLS